MRPIRREVERRLQAGQRWGVPTTAGECRELRKRRQAHWPCVRPAGGAPSHYAAERALRPGGLWCNGCVGRHNAEGRAALKR